MRKRTKTGVVLSVTAWLAAASLTAGAATTAAPVTPTPRPAASAPPVAAAPATKNAISAAAYRAELQRDIATLHRFEIGKSPNAATIAATTPTLPETVQRADGATQKVDYADLQRIVSPRIPGMTARPLLGKHEIHRLVENLRARVVALDEWTSKPGGDYYGALDGDRQIAKLVGSGQIVVTASRSAIAWRDFKRKIEKALDNFFKRLFGSRSWTPSASPIKINPAFVQYFWWSCVLSLLLVICYLLYKHLGGRWGGPAARREIRYLEGEDAELLALPIDELRARAGRFAEDGNYREALRHLYIAVLVSLDTSGVWRYDTRRTNWEHVDGLRGTPAGAALMGPMGELTRRFDRVRYGNAPASQRDWTRFAGDVAKLDRLVAAGGEATAQPAVGAEATQ